MADRSNSKEWRNINHITYNFSLNSTCVKHSCWVLHEHILLYTNGAEIKAKIKSVKYSLGSGITA